MELGAAQAKQEEYQALRRYMKLAEAGVSRRLGEVLERELTPRQLEFMRLYYMEQKNMYDIAAERGVAVSTVSRTLKRARGRLRSALRYGGAALLRQAVED